MIGGKYEKNKVIQIGIGHDHATAILDCMLMQTEIFEIAALAIPESEKADFSDRIEKYKKRLPLMTVEEALATEALDAVIVETEEVNLTKYALLAAKGAYRYIWISPAGLMQTILKSLSVLPKVTILFCISAICTGIMTRSRRL